MIALYAGSFDPPTVGHVDIIRRAARLFEELIVLAIRNPGKASSVSMETRLAWLRECAGDLANVRFLESEGLLLDAVRAHRADAILRGLRGERDYMAERETAAAYLDLYGVETVFLESDPRLAYASSTMVREIVRLGGDADKLIPPAIRDAVYKAYAKGQGD
ncbi:MAG: pantetheine-phosphate adenylyltransferase [Clostridia bacterium]|nr:pantetheine-phosphate adenylyltransferase [Clostridia bacterium]